MRTHSEPMPGKAGVLPILVCGLLFSLVALAQQSSVDTPLAHRRLTVEQMRALLASARPFKGQRISVSHIRGDVEGETLAGDIVGSLRKAGWAGLDGFGVAETDFKDVPTGVLVSVNGGDVKTTAAAQMLLQSLRESGLVSNGGNDDRVAESTVSLIIGRRPASMTPLTIPIAIPHSAAVQANPFVCPRPAPGDLASQPGELHIANGVLRVELSLYGGVDIQGSKVFCYLTATGMQSPTLRVRPGDELILMLKNQLSPSFGRAHVHSQGLQPVCAGDGPIDASSTNLHFHGWSVPPTCHQDDTLRTVIQPSDPAFEYRIRIPADQAPGLYWYHPHPHGFTEAQVQGGASGALIVEGIEQRRPEVAGLPERVLVLRDRRVPGLEESETDTGEGKDVSLNFVPVPYPLYHPTELLVLRGKREFWRVLNASADTYFDLQVRYGSTTDRTPQALRLVALDGAPIGAMNAGSSLTHVLLPPGSRAEFITAALPIGMPAELVSLPYDTGPDGTATPYRVLATIRSREEAPAPEMPASTQSVTPKPLASPARLVLAARRKLYFSEDLTDSKDPKYFITAEGAKPKVFRMDFTKPDIIVHQGTVEHWVVENRAREAHAFHIHQLHFQVLERDGKRLNDPVFRDTIDLPFWDGKSRWYPSVKLRMDFRSPEIVGTFVFHCHILEHEDRGMMGSIQVLPPQ